MRINNQVKCEVNTNVNSDDSSVLEGCLTPRKVVKSLEVWLRGQINSIRLSEEENMENWVKRFIEGESFGFSFDKCKEIKNKNLEEKSE